MGWCVWVWVGAGGGGGVESKIVIHKNTEMVARFFINDIDLNTYSRLPLSKGPVGRGLGVRTKKYLNINLLLVAVVSSSLSGFL